MGFESDSPIRDTLDSLDKANRESHQSQDKPVPPVKFLLLHLLDSRVFLLNGASEDFDLGQRWKW